MCKENKGITLIALVLTIIIMLILMVITVNTLFGENRNYKCSSKSKD